LEGATLAFELCPSVELVVHGPANRANAARALSVGLRSIEPGSRGDWPWRVSERSTQIHAGEYWLLTRTHELEDGAATCVQAVRLNGRAVMDGRIKVEAAAATRLEVILSEQCGAISGRAVWQGNPAPLSMVVVLLSGSARNPGDLFMMTTDDGGSFELAG